MHTDTFSRKIIYVSCVLFAIASCDSTSTYQGNEVAATKKMKAKVQKVQAGLQQHCDSMLYREARRLVDSIRN